MAPAELRVPEAMIALDLWLPAVQEVTFKNYCTFNYLIIIHLKIIIQKYRKISDIYLINEGGGLGAS